MAVIPLRLRALGQRSRLDEALAEGADPTQDPALALRASQLTAPATRRAIAKTIQNLVDAAEEPPDAWPIGGPRPPLQHDDVLAARDELLAVAQLLSGPEPVSPQTVALAARLVWDCASPVYAAGDFSVWEWARAVAAA
jgi:hypothetical protein